MPEEQQAGKHFADTELVNANIPEEIRRVALSVHAE